MQNILNCFGQFTDNFPWYSNWWIIKSLLFGLEPFGSMNGQQHIQKLHNVSICKQSRVNWSIDVFQRWNRIQLKCTWYRMAYTHTHTHPTPFENSKCFTTLSVVPVSIASKSFDVQWYPILCSSINEFIVTNQCQWNVHLVCLSRRS